VILQALHDATPRVRVMLLLGSEAGLRRAEIAAVRRSDITATARTGKLHITGKGRRQRIVPLTDRLIAELDMYPAAGAGQWLFPSPRRSGPIGAVRVGELLSDALPAPWTAHSLRHRFATVAYANSHDLLLVQHLMGHSKPETTAAYVQLDTTAARAVVSRGALVA
jgi:integrase